jgi:DNA polymerase III alpha subunit
MCCHVLSHDAVERSKPRVGHGDNPKTLAAQTKEASLFILATQKMGRIERSYSQTRLEKLEAETELFGYAVTGHPLELFPGVASDTYCPVNQLHQHIGETIVTCGLVVEQRTHHQITGEPMKFMTLADWTGMVETELFAQTYKSYGLATVRYPVLEVEAKVEAFENGRGFTLRVFRACKPRTR